MVILAPNTCCCKWRTNTILPGWRGKWKLYIGKPHNHFCWPLSKSKTGTMICRPGLRRLCGGKQGFGGRAGDTLAWLEQAVPRIRRQYSIKEDGKAILGGYSLAGLFALWAATQTDALYGVAAASPSVWFPGWSEYEAAHPIQAQRVYLSLGDREEHTKNQTMAAVGDNIRTLHSALIQRGKACTLEWNAGGHFKDADLRTARAFAWVMEEKR